MHHAIPRYEAPHHHASPYHEDFNDDIMMPARSAHIPMSEEEAADYSHRQAELWEEKYDKRKRETLKRQKDEDQASYNERFWEEEQAELKEEMLAKLEAEVLAARQAQKWKQERSEQIKRAEEQEIAAAKQATLRRHEEQETAEAADQTRFQRYAETLRKKDWDELREERELRRAREKQLFTHKFDTGISA